MFDLALRNLLRTKVRSFLTIVGIGIGIAAVIGLGSIGVGLKEAVVKELKGFAGLIFVFPKPEAAGADIDPFLPELEKVENVERATKIVRDIRPLGEGMELYPIFGVDPAHVELFLMGLEAEEGRLLEEADEERRVALVSHEVTEKLKLEVGDELLVGGKEFKIVGILEKGGMMEERMIVVPLSQLEALPPYSRVSWATVKVEDIRAVEETAKSIEEEFEELEAVTQQEIMKGVLGVLQTVELVTIGIGAIAAVVAGIGILNVMLMAVAERRREIGLLKALGATHWQILSLFMREALLLGIFGWLIGLVLGGTAVYLLKTFLEIAALGFELLLLSLAIALGLGMLGGIYPAYRAMQLDPVEALRYE